MPPKGCSQALPKQGQTRGQEPGWPQRKGPLLCRTDEDELRGLYQHGVLAIRSENIHDADPNIPKLSPEVANTFERNAVANELHRIWMTTEVYTAHLSYILN